MCVGDWRLGRLVRSVVSNQSISAGVNAVLAANRQRVGVLVSMGGSATIAATMTTRIQVDGLDVCFLGSGQLSRLFTVQESGDLPTKQFTIVRGNIDFTACFVEFFLPEEVLSAGIEQFRSQFTSLGMY